MKLPRPLAGAILLTFLLIIRGVHCQDDQSPNLSAGATEELQDLPLNANSQISALGVDVPGADEYEDEPDDLEIQASEHEIEAVYSGSGGPRQDPAAAVDEKIKKPKRRRRRRRRRKRIRTSTSSYEDVGEKNADLGDLPAEALDEVPPAEVLDYPRRRPIKRKRKPTTPIPIEEEYLLTVKNNARRTTPIPSIAPSYRPSIAPNHLPENIEEIIEQEPAPQDSLKIKQIVNNLPPVIVIPTNAGAPLIVPLPTAMTPTRNTTKVEDRPPVHINLTRGMSPELIPHGKQNKIDVRLSEPILFVTAPQDVEFPELSRVTQPVKPVPSKFATTTSPVVFNLTHATTPKTTIAPSTSKPTAHNAESPKNTLLKKLVGGAVNSSRDSASRENTSKEVSRDNERVGTSITEKISSDIRKPIRRLPPVGTLFRKRLPTPHTTTETLKLSEETTVSKENELAELKLYTESPLDLQKVGSVRLNEIPPTVKVNTFKPLKDNSAHEKELSDNSVYRKEELKLKYTSTSTPLHVKYATSTSVPVNHETSIEEQRTPEVHTPLKHIPSSPLPAKHVPSGGTKTAYTPNIDLIIDYTSSSRRPTTTSTEQSIQIVTADESLNTISHSSGETKTSNEDQATRINLEIPQTKEDIPQVKDDILIFLKSKAESSKLSRILQSRNMTLNELIEHRERGSSQLHLAEIFKSSPKAIPEADFELSPLLPITLTEEPTLLGSFPNSISQEVLHADSPNHRQPKFLFDSLPQFPPMEAEASQTIYTTQRFGPELHYTRSRPLLPNAKLTPFYGSSEELILSYTSSTGRPLLGNYGANEIGSLRELRERDSSSGNKRISSELKSVITISGAIIAFAVLGFFVLLISCKVRHRKSQKFIKAGMLREHLREATLRSSTRSDTPVVKNGYYAGCDHTSDTSSTARQTYLWKTIRKTFRYE